MSKPKPVENLSYEEAYAELETILAALESNDNPLQETMDLFVRGQALVKHCATLLENAELKIKQIAGELFDEHGEAG